MDKLCNSEYIVTGGKPLKGEVRLSGSKHSITLLIGAILLVEGRVTLNNFPDITDATEMLKIYESFGVKVSRKKNSIQLKNDRNNLRYCSDSIDSVKKLRASILLLGGALLRFKEVKFPVPGGDNLKGRDFHTYPMILESFSIQNRFEGNTIWAKIEKPLEGNRTIDVVTKKGPCKSCVGTYTLALAIILATGNKGCTTIPNMIHSSEIDELLSFVQTLGVTVNWISESELRIESNGIDFSDKRDIFHTVDPDKNEFLFWLVASLITKGSILVDFGAKYRIDLDHLGPLVDIYPRILRPIGINLKQISDSKILIDSKDSNVLPFSIFIKYKNDTNLIDPLIHLFVLMCFTEGLNVFHDLKFGQERFKGTKYLKGMGANITVNAKSQFEIHGVQSLIGKNIEGSDIRDTANLLLASLNAYGETRLKGSIHICRAYDSLIQKLIFLGANIQSV